MLVYGQCGHAGISETFYLDEDTGLTYIEITPNDRDTLVSLEVANELIKKLSEIQDVPIGSLALLYDVELLPGAFEILLQGMRTSNTLKNIRFFGINIGAYGIRLLRDCLIENGRIKSLILAGTCKSTEEVREIARIIQANTNINWVGLGRNEIGVRGLNIIIQGVLTNMKLLRVDLDDNHIDSNGAHYIRELLFRNMTLRDLRLNDNQLRDNGAIMIAEGIAANRSLRRLDIANNQIGNDGGGAIAGALRDNRTLIELDVYGNNIDTQVLVEASSR